MKPGTVALDGTKIHTNASRHGAPSYGHTGKIKARLKAEAADQADVPDGMQVPEELARRMFALTGANGARSCRCCVDLVRS